MFRTISTLDEDSNVEITSELPRGIPVVGTIDLDTDKDKQAEQINDTPSSSFKRSSEQAYCFVSNVMYSNLHPQHFTILQILIQLFIFYELIGTSALQRSEKGKVGIHIG